ncbi:protease [Paenibacillus sp. CAA11]|uniref:protease n=1 Tax=Paenibacillus sp. CAA11 TaxID=1532905 RepID=UPI000D3DBE8C|nr:protease [Paenibacillus sp. CAA11]AWB45650.1 protease [Paenibacillus sp. CAA11]
METLFLSCLAGGVLFALVSVLLGDVISDLLGGALDFLSVDFFKPVVIAGAITAFGGAGLLLNRHTGLSAAGVIVLAILCAVFIAVLVYFGYVRPMENSENSTGYSIRELSGKVGEVTIPIPPSGFGEIMVSLVGGHTLHIAASWEKREIAAGTRVVVVDTREGILLVSELDEREGDV